MNEPMNQGAPEQATARSEARAPQPAAPGGRSRLRRLLWGVLGLIVAAGIAAGSVRQLRKMRSDRESRALAAHLSEALAKRVEPERVARLEAACAATKSGCECFELSARDALDANLGAEVIEQARAAEKPCALSVVLGGLAAEATVRAGKTQEGQLLALEARKKNPNDPYAAYAMALGAFASSTLSDTQKAAEEALKLGRGPETERLLSRVTFARGEFPAAREHLERLLQAFPKDIEALFTLGMLEVKAEHYDEARRAFVKVLVENPKHLEARKYLFLVTLTNGALFEARHHLDELEAIDPNFAGRTELENALAERQRVRAADP